MAQQQDPMRKVVRCVCGKWHVRQDQLKCQTYLNSPDVVRQQKWDRYRALGREIEALKAYSPTVIAFGYGVTDPTEIEALRKREIAALTRTFVELEAELVG